ncbi:C39 family peptidase [Paenibacillus sp. FSL R5-0527]|uniref:C39 family peptidase n=1 Tax=Paenibacillus sp. FSL R5-0527 TaxID=2975321 RepID=UPI00097B1747|nr:hypothetical protein BK140_04545 [Paenibacillus macerans]
MIAVVPHGDKKMTCLEAEVSSVLKWMKRSHEMMFLDSWGIDYQDNVKVRLGEKISLGKRENRFTYLERFHGVKVTYVEGASSDEIKKVISKGTPVTVFGNMYWIPWEHPYYLKRDAPGHSFTVLGYIENENSFVCMDCNFSNSYQIIGADDFNRCVQNYLTYSIVDENAGITNWRKAIASHLQFLKDKNTLNRIDWFCEDIKVSLDLKYEFEDYEVNSCPIFVRLTKVANGRFLFSRALNFISENCNDSVPEKYSSKFSALSDEWLILRGYLYKSYLQSIDNELVKIAAAEKVARIANSEKILLEQLLSETIHLK